MIVGAVDRKAADRPMVRPRAKQPVKELKMSNDRGGSVRRTAMAVALVFLLGVFAARLPMTLAQVGLVKPGFSLVLDPTEVAGTFEAPLRHLLDPSTHARRRRRIAGEEIETIDLPWGSFNIWGATAGMLLTLREILAER